MGLPRVRRGAADCEEIAAAESTSHEEQLEALTKECEELTQRVAEAVSEASKSEERFTRQVAEFQNFKARQSLEEAARLDRALARIAEPLLTLLDDFERARSSLPDGPEVKLLAPFRLTLLDILAQEFKLKPMIDSVGSLFDASVHEAVATRPDAE